MIKELEKENGALFKELKLMNFGQFLFLYFFARNTSYEVCCEVLEKVKERNYPNSETNKSRKTASSGLSSSKSSWENLKSIGNVPYDQRWACDVHSEEMHNKRTYRKDTGYQDTVKKTIDTVNAVKGIFKRGKVR